MKYNRIIEAKFLSRPNRFIAEVEIDGTTEIAHVKNTGRCAELLVPGCRVWLDRAPEGSGRRTKFDLVTVEKGSVLVNMDSQAPNAAVAEWIGFCFPNATRIRREVKHGASRFDFCVEEDGRTSFVEVKGVTLERDGVAMFPDAPTERGVKHVLELADCSKAGYGAYVVFVIQMKGIRRMIPNWDTHPAFGEALRTAKARGVEILAVDCIVTPDSMTIDGFVEVEL